ncbi:GAF domain-containing protein [Halomonas sp. ZH2S]|uniref:GAF domain-containing protein n=1 Tax=Vreelandella zhuhanensis TaxID=2684210 RepID=A0A7X3GY04_9GAMM|nr:GAF domain-containing protein [Halomonas zhuhanensis]MWJ26649.1 GAF domain-containing protein [Halomonas zhuhanensis]
MTTHRGFLAQCEHELLHLSGAIQPHGALLAVAADGRVTHASDNLGTLLGLDPQSLLGEALPAPLATPLGRLGQLPGARLFVPLVEGVAGDFALLASRNAAGQAVIELLPDNEEEMLLDDVSPLVHIGSREELMMQRQSLVERIVELSGFDRVLFYRFLPSGDGEVLAEALGAGAQGRYLGLRFPASDIPGIARALYVKNPWRSIPDAAAVSVPLLGLDDAPPPDLTLADLRSLSPMHQLYLHNMGVASAISFPLTIGDELTALISCHAVRPRRLPLSRLNRLSQEVESFALAEKTYRTRTRQNMLDGLERHFNGVRRQVTRQGGLRQAWSLLSPWLMTEFDADGAMLCGEGTVLREGLSLEPEALDAVERWCEGEEVVTRISDHLLADCPEMPLSEVAGLLAISLLTPSGERLRCYLCREEEAQEVAWGGNPDKPVEFQSGPVPIAPRRSFETWLETRLGYSRPWPEQARLKLLKLRQLLQEAT